MDRRLWRSLLSAQYEDLAGHSCPLAAHLGLFCKNYISEPLAMALTPLINWLMARFW